MGVQVVSQLTDLATEVQQHRVALQLQGKPEFDGSRTQSEKAMGVAMAAIDASVKTYPELSLSTRWSTLRPDVQALMAPTQALNAAELFTLHGKVVDGLRKLTQYTGETSTLVLDPVAATYFLQDVLVEQGIAWIEAVSRTRAVGAAWLSDSTDREAHSAALATLVDLIDARTENVAAKMEALTRAGGVTIPKEAQAALSATAAFTKAARDSIGKEPTPENAGTFF